MIKIIDTDQSYHVKIPILGILASAQMLVDLFELLKQNGAEISPFDRNLKYPTEVISINKGALYVSVEQETEGEDLIIRFYEYNVPIYCKLLAIILNFIRKNRLRILENRVHNLLPRNFPPPNCQKV